jgi:hypothetical protein
MGWEIWLVPIAALAFWIIGTLMRNSSAAGRDKDTQEANRGVPQRPGQQPQRPGQPDRPLGPPRRAQQSSADLDRFLQEVSRRKQGAAPPRPAEPVARPAEQPRRPTASRPAPTSRPATAARPAAPPRPVAQRPTKPTRARPVAVEPIPVVEVLPVQEEPASTAPREQWAAPVQAAVVTGTAVGAGLTQPTFAAEAGAVRAIPERLAQIMALLKTPQQLRAAMVLREVLDPPLSQRRRR